MKRSHALTLWSKTMNAQWTIGVSGGSGLYARNAAIIARRLG
ncbi:hypothetical protein [Sphingomonas hominis]|nr:hypothetical protein [Sphingomonas hominis]